MSLPADCPVCLGRKVVAVPEESGDFAPRVVLKPCPECVRLHVVPWWVPILFGIAVWALLFFATGCL